MNLTCQIENILSSRPTPHNFKESRFKKCRNNFNKSRFKKYRNNFSKI